MEWDRINVLKRYLKRSGRARDIKAFNQYMKGEISIKECIDCFRYNNKISPRMPILEDEFREWLWTLGYRRNIYEEEKTEIRDSGDDRRVREAFPEDKQTDKEA